eukprot:CAMPEP_0198501240 /NCGR_PEP_ID=MMETSP1462-20131121/8598_1 /TAXON_ID=1333877 /ORGANISM="Brandtodinium nutriculum, Strain RCC3387" /LENGTH=55 /DNA_ID=CAMNT_0044230271 /DNA_START=69 /DNA_END=233 /DNA_ORIENTATION=-
MSISSGIEQSFGRMDPMLMTNISSASLDQNRDSKGKGMPGFELLSSIVLISALDN